MAKRDNRLAARALADWAREGFKRSAERHIADKYSVSTRTLWRWKDALDDDSELSAQFKERLNDLLDRDWAAELDAALAETVERIRALIANARDLGQVVEAFRALSEVAITREVLREPSDAASHSTNAAAGREGTEAASLPN